MTPLKRGYGPFLRATLRVALAGACLAHAVPARAQSPQVPGWLEVGFGAAWIGQIALGTVDASETTSAGTPSRLFTGATTLSSGAGMEGRAAVRVTSALEAEVAASYTHPTLETAVSADSENASSVTATERLDQFTIGGGVLWYLSRWRASGFQPFAMASASYLKHLHEGRIVTATGQAFQLGGGAKFMLVSRPASRVKGLGVRADARITARRKGVAFDSTARYSPTLAVSVFARF